MGTKGGPKARHAHQHFRSDRQSQYQSGIIDFFFGGGEGAQGRHIHLTGHIQQANDKKCRNSVAINYYAA